MNRILIVAEHDGERLSPSVARCVRCARDIPDAEIHVLVLATSPGVCAEQASRLDNVSKVLVVSHVANAHPLAAVLEPQVVAAAAGYTHVIGPSSTFGRDLMPRVAARLGVSQISDVMAVQGAWRFLRPTYAGNANTVVEAVAGQPVVLTARTASFEAVGEGGSAPIEALAIEVELPTHTRFVSLQASKSDRPDLQTATKVVSGGRAFGSAENFAMLYRLADRLGAAVGASRAAVDAGYAPNELQVGQTGKIIAPQLYLAIGISGAIQHLTGIKDARTIVAINKDGDAPIFEIADYGLVGDLFTVLPELESKL